MRKVSYLLLIAVLFLSSCLDFFGRRKKASFDEQKICSDSYVSSASGCVPEDSCDDIVGEGEDCDSTTCCSDGLSCSSGTCVAYTDGETCAGDINFEQTYATYHINITGNYDDAIVCALTQPYSDDTEEGGGGLINSVTNTPACSTTSLSCASGSRLGVFSTRTADFNIGSGVTVKAIACLKKGEELCSTSLKTRSFKDEEEECNLGSGNLTATDSGDGFTVAYSENGLYDSCNNKKIMLCRSRKIENSWETSCSEPCEISSSSVSCEYHFSCVNGDVWNYDVREDGSTRAFKVIWGKKCSSGDNGSCNSTLLAYGTPIPNGCTASACQSGVAQSGNSSVCGCSSDSDCPSGKICTETLCVKEALCDLSNVELDITDGDTGCHFTINQIKNIVGCRNDINVYLDVSEVGGDAILSSSCTVNDNGTCGIGRVVRGTVGSAYYIDISSELTVEGKRFVKSCSGEVTSTSVPLRVDTDRLTFDLGPTAEPSQGCEYLSYRFNSGSWIGVGNGKCEGTQDSITCSGIDYSTACTSPTDSVKIEAVWRSYDGRNCTDITSLSASCANYSPQCNSNYDCGNNEYCSSGNCEKLNCANNEKICNHECVSDMYCNSHCLCPVDDGGPQYQCINNKCKFIHDHPDPI